MTPSLTTKFGLVTCGALALLTTAEPAHGQACPAGRACFYVPPALPSPPGFTVDWDMVLASPRGTITGTWQAGTGASTPFSVSPGVPLVVPLSATEGTAAAYGTAETRGIFVDASSQELLVDHRLIEGPWQSSSTAKSSAFALGTRFRLAGYNLNGDSSADTGFDYAAVYAPFGATVTFEAPAGATLPFWEATANASLVATLTAGQTYIARTVPGASCSREIDAALVTSSDPIAVDTGGRGWATGCGVSGDCGDDGVDNVLPTSGLGTQYVLMDFPSPAANGEDALVVADTANTEVRVDGALVATLAAGETHTITPILAATYVETSQPAYLYQTTGLLTCETDMALIPGVVLAPLGSWSTDFNVPATFSARVGLVLEATTAPSVLLDGSAPAGATTSAVPGRSDLGVVMFDVTEGNHSVTASADFQLGLVTSGSGTGLFGYYTPFRIPDCGNNIKAGTEGCDDGDLDDGDGCSSSCKIEIGFTGCGASDDCVPVGRCDAGTCVARCLTDVECDDSNLCTTDSCSGSGACVNAPVAAGSAGGCASGLTCSGPPDNACVSCGNGTIELTEACDDGDTSGGDGCSATCTVENGWSCSCGAPTFTYSNETPAGRLGGDGGSAGPLLGCSGNDVLIGLQFEWAREAVTTTAVCGSVSVTTGGVVSTTQTTTQTSGGLGCGGWSPTAPSPVVTCPSGSAIVGLTGKASVLNSTVTLFDEASIVCQQMGVDGTPFGPTTTLNIPGGAGVGAGGDQTVSCPAGTIARWFQTRSGCAQDALDLQCGLAAVACVNSGSICSTNCGDGVVGAPTEECDDTNVAPGDGCSATCAVEPGWDCVVNPPSTISVCTLPPDGGAPDAGPDGGAPTDAGSDAAADAGPDAVADAGPDAVADAGLDAVADAGSGGTPGAGGSSGTAGAGSGGTPGAGGSSGTAGAGSGGRSVPPDAGVNADAGDAASPATAGGVAGGACGCRTSPTSPGHSWLLMAIAIAAAMTRRKGSRARNSGWPS